MFINGFASKSANAAYEDVFSAEAGMVAESEKQVA